MSDEQNAALATPKTKRAIRMNGLRSDGQSNTDLVDLVVKDPVTGQEIRENDGTPAVVIKLRPLADGEHDAIIKANTNIVKSPGGQKIVELVNDTAVSDAIMRRVIHSWTGIVACDDRPLPCTDVTKVRLDERVKVQVSRKLFGAEAVEVSADTFR